MREWAEEMLEDVNPEALFMDGLDGAIIGVTTGQPGMASLVVYDEEEILRLLITQGAEFDDAWEYYHFNVEGAYVGPNTPIILKRPSEMDGVLPGPPTELER